MKFNKWTLGLAAVGVVSLATATQADESQSQMSMVQTALSSTTLSGYVDTSVQYNPTGGGVTAPVSFNGNGGANGYKSNGFNLNVVDLALDHPEDESPWAAGYHVELWAGPDASALGTGQAIGFGNNNGYNSSESIGIRQAYVTLRTPVGNGIDWKLGVFDSIIGYESTSDMLNPNYTHSYGYTMEPTTQTGLLATYAFTSELSVSAGMADSTGPLINDRNPQTEGGAADSFKTYMASITFTAPQSWGWAAGSTLSGGVITGDSTFGYDAVTHWYLGASMATPITALKVGASFDYEASYERATPANGVGSGSPWATALYATYQATPKLSFNSRAELAKPLIGQVVTLNNQGPANAFVGGSQGTVFALTESVQYDMWANVLTRAEIRWDSTAHNYFGGNQYGTGNLQRNAVMFALQAIYKF